MAIQIYNKHIHEQEKRLNPIIIRDYLLADNPNTNMINGLKQKISTLFSTQQAIMNQQDISSIKNLNIEKGWHGCRSSYSTTSSTTKSAKKGYLQP